MPTRSSPRRKDGTLYPSIARRMKVLYRCTGCGLDLLKREVALRESVDPLDRRHRLLELHHGTPRCGPVTWEARATVERKVLRDAGGIHAT